MAYKQVVDSAGNNAQARPGRTTASRPVPLMWDSDFGVPLPLPVRVLSLAKAAFDAARMVPVRMDTSSKGGLPSPQTRASREDTLGLSGGSNGIQRSGQPVARMRPSAGIRPSTGRLISPAQARQVTLRGRISRLVASSCIARLVVLASEDARSPVVIDINSSEGSVSEVLGILSTMNGIHCPVVTFCRGEVMGPATIIAAHGLRGYRVAAPRCRFCFRIQRAEDDRDDLVKPRSLLPLLAELLAKDTRRRREEVLDWLRNGATFGPEEALRLGLIDAIAIEPLFPKMVSQ